MFEKKKFLVSTLYYVAMHGPPPVRQKGRDLGRARKGRYVTVVTVVGSRGTRAPVHKYIQYSLKNDYAPPRAARWHAETVPPVPPLRNL